MPSPDTPESGFSLVELSIVLVILGLLVGGVLGGQSLIRAAELRSISRDYESYLAAVHTFRGKYHALPGDMKNAVRFWGAQAGGTADGVDATCAALDFYSPATGQATCNGNGDGRVTLTGTLEVWRVWQHLANAGLVTGQFSGVNGDAAIPFFGKAGFNMPVSKATGGGFVLHYTMPSASVFLTTSSNIFRYGGEEGVDQHPGMLPAEEAWSVDKKIDDGRPATGVVQAYRNNIRPDCVSTDDAATAEYLLDKTNRGCNLVFVPGL